MNDDRFVVWAIGGESMGRIEHGEGAIAARTSLDELVTTQLRAEFYSSRRLLHVTNGAISHDIRPDF